MATSEADQHKLVQGILDGFVTTPTRCALFQVVDVSDDNAVVADRTCAPEDSALRIPTASLQDTLDFVKDLDEEILARQSEAYPREGQRGVRLEVLEGPRHGTTPFPHRSGILLV